ncbi:SH3-domain-containing protein [Macrolepiota fuliginosa MF-IS2]|uniref:SH3-domain-containing protein n=1 Tax=Macrolepiota fuliginosa MF-IS2 TaxID=1400762 RepID=A0A9P5XBL9_9AGAR|nr:SH3-domain-containing protein [Macrolepiota fuliginosa MF-IS2]
MVFTNLGTHEKDAFFTLLDEYFASRPEIFSATNNSSPTPTNANPFRKEITGAQAHAAAAAAGRAGDAAARFVSAGLKNMNSTSHSPTAGGRATPPAPASATAGQHGDSDNMDTRSGGSLADRIAAMQGGAKRNDTGGSGGAADRPASHGVSGLSSTRKFGDVDTSSAKNFFGSLRNTSSNPPKSFQATHSSGPADNVPSAFPPKNSGSKFGPPPTRAAVPPPPPPPQPQPQEEEGDWAEAIYGYDSAEPGDLELTEGMRVLVIERTSGDWWTGEANGKKGLFPASYVQLL